MSDASISAPSLSLAGKRVTLGVSGSIAAYKAVVLARALLKAGARLEVVMTRGASEFVGAATFAGLTGRAVHQDMFDGHAAGEKHVELAEASDLILIVPATADLLARLAGGRADDLLCALALCARCPLLLAPAMHPSMWTHPATVRNVEQLARDGRATLVGPVVGEVASGAVGLGRMAEPEDLLEAAARVLGPDRLPSLAGRHIVVSAGPTVEELDPVRYLGNRSSGKMGFALAERAAALGARVTLVAGPVALATPRDVTRLDVQSTSEMRDALWRALGSDLSQADALIMAAAVADYRPAQPSKEKLKRGAGPLVLELAPNADLLAEIGAARARKQPILVGFALETDPSTLVDAAREKLTKKRVDLVVANLSATALGGERTAVTLVGPSDTFTLPELSKHATADHILTWIHAKLSESA